MNPAQHVEKIAPVRKSVVVRRTPEEAFAIFTERMASWWPLATHSLFEAEAGTCGIEPRVGGKIYETSRSGERTEWGTILTWEPPRRFVTTWHPGQDPENPTEVEVRFTAVPEGTRVDLEHRNWEKLGEKAAMARNGYDQGWVEVFERRFVEGCA
jgi:uncharacterized protein YndB with AHSA1/START domain